MVAVAYVMRQWWDGSSDAQSAAGGVCNSHTLTPVPWWCHQFLLCSGEKYRHHPSEPCAEASLAGGVCTEASAAAELGVNCADDPPASFAKPFA